MTNTNTTSRTTILFIKYHSILTKQRLPRIITDNQKLAVAHVLSAIKTAALKDRLESDLAFSHHD